MINIEDLAFSYEKKKVLNSISLTVNNNEIFLIEGNIGSGKTTLFRILTGFYSEFTGSVKYDDIEISQFDIPKNISFVEQNTDYQLLTLSVKSELELFSNGKINNNMIDYFELNGLLDRNPQTLSSSEKRRVLLAGVFSSNTKYIFMDEPTADLDNYFTNKLLKLIDKEKRTIIIFSHDKKLKDIKNFRNFSLK